MSQTELPRQGAPPGPDAVRTEPPEATPPAGSVQDLLARLLARLSIESIDEIWIFPARKLGAAESTVVVVAAYDPEGEDRRGVLTARYTVTREKNGSASVTESVVEQGTAPHDRVGRVVEGVLRRLGEDLDAPPRYARVAGEPTRWSRLLAALPAPEPAPEP